MKELELKYGCNPNQKPSRIFVENGELPIEVLNGKPGYSDFLQARFPGRSSDRSASQRCGKEDLLGRRSGRSVSAGMRLCQSQRC